MCHYFLLFLNPFCHHFRTRSSHMSLSSATIPPARELSLLYFFLSLDLILHPYINSLILNMVVLLYLWLLSFLLIFLLPPFFILLFNLYNFFFISHKLSTMIYLVFFYIITALWYITYNFSRMKYMISIYVRYNWHIECKGKILVQIGNQC